MPGNNELTNEKQRRKVIVTYESNQCEHRRDNDDLHVLPTRRFVRTLNDGRTVATHARSFLAYRYKKVRQVNKENRATLRTVKSGMLTATVA